MMKLKFRSYELPPILVDRSGKTVINEQEWTKRRKEILEMLEKSVYGKTPGDPLQNGF